MDGYTSTIQSSYYSLKELDHAPSTANIAWQLLKGLSSSYDAFISRKYAEISEKITKKEDIDLNKLIAELISEENRIQSFIKDEDKAFIAKYKPNMAKYCKYCSKTGHLEESCWLKHPELRPQQPKKEAIRESSLMVIHRRDRIL